MGGGRLRDRMSVDGVELAYEVQGDGEPVVLVHGTPTWSYLYRHLIRSLSKTHRVIAPDLIGHGDSAAVRGDYSLGAHASGVRDLLSVLGHDRVTVVGHSLGGGIAMQFAYQFPERCQRLVLVSSGGLGQDVHPVLRAATLPGSELVLPLIAHEKLLEIVRDSNRKPYDKYDVMREIVDDGVDILDGGFNGPVDSTLEAHRIDACSNALQAFLDDRIGENGCRRRAVSGDVVGLRCYLFQ